MSARQKDREGLWEPVYDDEADVQSPTRWKMGICGFVIHLFRSKDSGSWLWSCTPFAREIIIGKMSEADAKRCVLLQVEAYLSNTVAQVSVVANNPRVLSIINNRVCVS